MLLLTEKNLDLITNEKKTSHIELPAIYNDNEYDNFDIELFTYDLEYFYINFNNENKIILKRKEFNKLINEIEFICDSPCAGDLHFKIKDIHNNILSITLEAFRKSGFLLSEKRNYYRIVFSDNNILELNKGTKKLTKLKESVKKWYKDKFISDGYF